MRTARLVSTVAALLLAILLGSASPAHAAAPPSYRYTTTGLTAVALFTDVPASGAVAGVSYHDTFVTAGQAATRSDGTRSSGSFAIVLQVVYSFDAQGTAVLQSQSFGFADGTAVSYTGDRRLAGAHLAATVPMQVCDPSYSCVAGGTQQVTIDWTGDGAVVRTNGTTRYVGDGIRYSSRFNGTSRPAAATGYGAAVFAQLESSTTSERCLGTGC